MTALNAEQSRGLKRSENVVNFCSKNEDTYTVLKPFAKKLGELIENNNQIVSLIPVRSANGEGDTTKKRISKKDIAESVNNICSLVIPYALEEGDSSLYNAVNFTTTDVVQMRDVAVLGFVNTLVGVVTPLLSRPGFADYPVTAEDLSALSGDADSFNSSLSDNKIIDKDSSIASANIDALLAGNCLIIRRLNKLVNYFEKKDPGFVTGYRSAAAVVNTGIHHSGVKGIISNNIGQPVEDVSVSLQSKKNIKTTATNSDGEYRIGKFISGKATLTITAPGYDSQVLDVTIVRGKTLELNMELQAKLLTLSATA